jgi:hypothetical protein
MFMIYICTKFHKPSSNGTLDTVIKLKSKETFQAAAILFYIIQKFINKIAYFRIYVTKHHFRALS